MQIPINKQNSLSSSVIAEASKKIYQQELMIADKRWLCLLKLKKKKKRVQLTVDQNGDRKLENELD